MVSPPGANKKEYCYLPISEEMHAWECFVTTVGNAVYLPGEPYPHRMHPSVYDFNWKWGRTLPEYQIVLITQGGGEYEFRKGEGVRCRRGDVFQIVPGQWHRYRPDRETGWGEACIGLGGAYLHRLRKKGLAFTQPRVATGEHYETIHDAFHKVIEMGRDSTHANNLLLASEAFRIIALLAQTHSEDKAEKPLLQGRDECLGHALEFIWGNSHRAIRVADVAEATEIQPRSLERLFAAAHTCSVRQEIEWSRFFRAQRLITHTGLSMKEIAYACGFSDPRRMIEVFRRRGGVTPSGLRTGAPESEAAPVRERRAIEATESVRASAVTAPLPNLRRRRMREERRALPRLLSKERVLPTFP